MAHRREGIRLCLDVFHHAATWVMGLARDLDRGRRVEDIEGLILYGEEIDALRIPLVDILERIAEFDANGGGSAREVLFWRAAIRRFVVVDAAETACHCRPGDAPPKGFLHHVEFHAETRCLPFTDIMLGLSRLARAAELPDSNMAFRYRGIAVRDGTTMLNVVRTHADEYKRIAEALDRWYDQMMRRVADALALRPPPTPDIETTPIPDEVRGVILPRADVVRLFGGSIRTLSRWDHDGHAHGGLPWVRGRRRANVVIYDIERNWPTLSTLRGRARDAARDRALAHEIRQAAKAWAEDGCG